MKSKKGSLAKAIVDSVVRNEDGDDGSDIDEETRATVTEELDQDEEEDIFSKDFTNSNEPQKSSLRIRNAFNQDLLLEERYKGQQSSRKQLKKDRGDEQEHEDADLGHMFEMAESDEDGEEEEQEESDDQEEAASGDEEEDGNAVRTFSKEDVKSAVSKGKAIQAQRSLWDSLLEARIQLQKCLSKVNCLPQPDQWAEYKSNADTEAKEAIKRCQTNLANTLDNLLSLRTHMLDNNASAKRSLLPTTDEEQEPQRKKLKLAEYASVLSTHHDESIGWRNATIDTWNDRTRLQQNQQKFSAFDSSTLKQIEHILADKPRLIKRTQLRRSAYKVIGCQDEKEYDHEVFDDDDFYHQLLRELIERKTSGVSDPVALGQQWLKLQKLRAKAKKKVDTKASKGRKTRYDIHAKLVNFMAPVYTETVLSEEAKSELFSSLFAGANA